MSPSNLIYTPWSPSESTPSTWLTGDEDEESHAQDRNDSLIERPDTVRPIVPPWVNFSGDRSDYRLVIRQFDRAYSRYDSESARSIALRYFRVRYSTSDWMQRQRGWLENASLLASVRPFSLAAERILYCSAGGLLCDRSWYCFRCNLDRRVEPLQAMFKEAFAQRPFWTSLVLDYEMNADRAGIWTGHADDLHSLWLPHLGKPGGGFLECGMEWGEPFKEYCKFLFTILHCLQKARIIDGWIGILEPNLSFWQGENPTYYPWTNIAHAFLPHLHVLVCGNRPLDETAIRDIYNGLQQFLGDTSYANVWFEAVSSQNSIRKWINYCVKPFPISTWYKHAVKAGCHRSELNVIFDDLALESCPGLMAQVRSPISGGVLAINSGRNCILNRLPSLLTKKQMQMCQDERYYYEHQDNFWRSIQKRMLRNGRSARQGGKTFEAALQYLQNEER